MQRTLPIGISDFKTIMERGNYYVDKSLMIKDLIDDGMIVYLFPRPRRFGKTLNLNMIRYFFEKTNEGTSNLFHDLKIWEYEKFRQEQGRYPVIYFTFKDIKNNNWEETYEGIRLLIQELYGKFTFLLDIRFLKEHEKILFEDVLFGRATQAVYESSLRILSELLNRFYSQKVVILIDEYDMPITGGHTHGFYQDVISFMRNFLSGGLKDNPALYLACLTGILRVAKESIFSGLNNLYVSSILKDKYSSYFGFTGEEVEELAKCRGKEDKLEEIKRWYNGYVFGKTEIYNPWSILNYFAETNEYLQAYWINSSSNDLIESLIAKSGNSVKRDFEILISDGVIHKPIDDNIIFKDIYISENALWSFLLMSGYLKAVDIKFSESDNPICTLQIPNLEVMFFYKRLFKNWLGLSLDSDNANMMLKALINGDEKDFELLLNQLLLKTISYFDTSESFYHGFVLGLLVELSDSYIIKSNRESGFGRYDIMMLPHDKEKNGVIIEFKLLLKSEDDVQKSLEQAQRQIEQKAYDTEMKENGIDHILKYAVVFKGKECFVSKKQKAEI